MPLWILIIGHWIFPRSARALALAAALALPAPAQTSKALVAMLPALDGWTLSTNIETFTNDTLFDRINGAADIFLSCNFVEMTAVDYTKNGSDKYVTLHLYRHATPDDAFAIYSAERSPGSTFLEIGAEGYRDAGLLHFLSGSVYAKLTTLDHSPEAAAMMEKVARVLAVKIDPAAALPAMLKTFPAQDKQPRSEIHVIDSFLGHKFMLPAWRATYGKSGKEYHLFVIDGKTSAGVQKLLADYAKFNKQTVLPSEGPFVMPDRFNGDIPMLWCGRYLYGLIAPPAAGIDAPALLKKTAAANSSR